jgi:hypothetical protein
MGLWILTRQDSQLNTHFEPLNNKGLKNIKIIIYIHFMREKKSFKNFKKLVFFYLKYEQIPIKKRTVICFKVDQIDKSRFET